MATVGKEYYNKVTTKESKVFKKYLRFIANAGIKLSGKNICDIGCATGNFIDQVKGSNHCFGVDYSSYAISFCRKRFKKISNHFSVADLSKVPKLPFKTKFDLITMFDVIEHVGNLSILKDLLTSSIKNNGYLLITTPNSNSLLRFINRKFFTGEMDKTHINLFTPYTLDFFLRKAGFRKVALSTPYVFYFHNNWLTKNLMFGGQIFALYQYQVEQKNEKNL